MKSIAIGKRGAMVPQKFSELNQSGLIDLASVYIANLHPNEARLFLASKWISSIYKVNQKGLEYCEKQVSKAVKHKFGKANVQRIMSQLLSRSEADIEDFTWLPQPVTQYWIEHHQNLATLSKLCAWYNDEHISDTWIMNELRLYRYVIWKTNFVGPGNRLRNMQFWQYCKAERYFTAYEETNNIADLLRFFACLYTPSGASWDETKIERHALYFTTLEDNERIAIMLNWVAIKKWLARSFPYVFKQKEGQESPGKADFGELLIRTSERQHADTDVIAKKPLLLELKKLDIANRDYEEFKEKNKVND